MKLKLFAQNTDMHELKIYYELYNNTSFIDGDKL